MIAGWSFSQVDGDGQKVSADRLYKPTDDDFAAIRAHLDKGGVVLYHFGNKDGTVKSSGHYGVLKGYTQNEDGSYDYIFHDPAGDRRKGYGYNSGAKRGKDGIVEKYHGENVHYSQELLQKTKVKGNLYYVKPKK